MRHLKARIKDKKDEAERQKRGKRGVRGDKGGKVRERQEGGRKNTFQEAKQTNTPLKKKKKSIIKPQGNATHLNQ